MPELHIITGSNGAGKSSVGPSYLPTHIRENCTVFDGDKLFMEHRKELWNTGMRAHKEIKKIALAYVEETFDNLVEMALENRSDFVYEGHFTNDATWGIPMFDSIKILDSSETSHSLLVHLADGKVHYTLPPDQLPAWFLRGLPNLTALIK